MVKENAPPSVELPPLAFQQVLLNILRNGAYAMQQAGTDDPMFIVKTRFDEHRQIVRVEIRDNGPGMDNTILKRVLNHFIPQNP